MLSSYGKEIQTQDPIKARHWRLEKNRVQRQERPAMSGAAGETLRTEENLEQRQVFYRGQALHQDVSYSHFPICSQLTLPNCYQVDFMVIFRLRPSGFKTKYDQFVFTLKCWQNVLILLLCVYVCSELHLNFNCVVVLQLHCVVSY